MPPDDERKRYSTSAPAEEFPLDVADNAVPATANRPVHLVGHLVGAAFAYMLVDVLRGRGQEVASLVVLDSPAPDDPAGERGRVEPIEEFFATIVHLVPDEALAAGRWREAAGPALHPRDDGLLTEAEVLLPAHAKAVLEGGLRRAYRDYRRMNALVWPRPRPVAVPALVVRATGDVPPGKPDPTDGWRLHLPERLVKEEVQDIHEGMLRGPGARRVAALVNSFLRSVTTTRALFR